MRGISIKINESIREGEEEDHTHPTTPEEDPGQFPCDLPLKQQNIFLFIFFDLPCKRTCHGKGRFTITKFSSSSCD